MDGKLKVSGDKKQDMIISLQNFFYKELDEDLGYIEANQLLDFFITKFAPSFYNEGVSDAHKFIGENLSNVLSLQKTNNDD